MTALITRPHDLYGLNAPFGARCFLTLPKPGPIEPLISGLNAPSGARCFLTPYQLVSEGTHFCVLMHLLALGASDPQCVVAHGNTWLQSQCAFWRSVLSDGSVIGGAVS